MKPSASKARGDPTRLARCLLYGLTILFASDARGDACFRSCLFRDCGPVAATLVERLGDRRAGDRAGRPPRKTAMIPEPLESEGRQAAGEPLEFTGPQSPAPRRLAEAKPVEVQPEERLPAAVGRAQAALRLRAAFLPAAPWAGHSPVERPRAGTSAVARVPEGRSLAGATRPTPRWTRAMGTRGAAATRATSRLRPARQAR